jgi:Ankyrin repeats (many copies)
MRKGWTNDIEVLFQAVEQHHCEQFLQLVTKEHANDTLEDGQTALHIFMCFPTQVAINPDTKARIKVIKQLLEWGIDINTQDSAGETALYCAVGNNDIAIIPFLLECGTDMHNPYKISGLENFGGVSPLNLAYKMECVGDDILMTKMFMLKGARREEFLKTGQAFTTSMLEFYESILLARQISTIIVGLHRYKKSKLFLINGKDCISLIARIVYSTRGDSIWNNLNKL